MSILVVLLLALMAYILFDGLDRFGANREYKSGTRSCFWRWTRVDSEYITRLHIVKTPWFAVCLHWINKPDAEPWLHDHPVSFLSIVLRGGYAELRASGDGDIGHKVHRWFNFVRAHRADRHRIIFARKNTLTLCFMGPKEREWGFHMPEGWVMWKDYYARLRSGENMRRAAVTDEPMCAWLDREMKTHYTEARIMQAVGAPIGKPVDEDVRAIDGDFAVSREQFYKTFTMEFGDEDPTEPRR